jgi:hypothetical protein
MACHRHNTYQLLEEPGSSHKSTRLRKVVKITYFWTRLQDYFKIMMETCKLNMPMGIHTVVFTMHEYFPYLEGGAGNPGCGRDIDWEKGHG